jgi:hypothetical protein
MPRSSYRRHAFLSGIALLKPPTLFQRGVAVLQTVLQSLFQVQARIGIGRYRKWINPFKPTQVPR